MKRIERLPSAELEVRDLRLVLALVSAGTTARAAELLHLAQPSVSRALLSLEDRLDTRLFERTHAGLVANAAGRQLAARAEPIIDELRALERSIREPAAEPTRIRVVCECVTAYHWLPTTLTALHQQLPGLELELCLEHTQAPLPALADGELDAALVTSPCSSSDTLRVGRLFADELLFLVSATHPLAARETLTPKDLAQHRLITVQPTAHEARWFMARVFGRARPKLTVTRLPLTEAAVDLARAGFGIAVLTEWVSEPYRNDRRLSCKRLSKGPLRRPWRLVWRRELGPAGPRLLRALRASRN